MLTLADVKRSYKKAAHCERRAIESAFKNEYKCAECKKEIAFGEQYFNIGIRATTAHQRFYGSKGCTWVKYCEHCACADLNPYL